MIRAVFGTVAAAILCAGLVAGLAWRLDGLHAAAREGGKGTSERSEDRKLFHELLAAGLLTPRPDGGLDRAPEDFLLRLKVSGGGGDAQKRETQRQLLKALDFSAVGSIVRQQVDLWNQSRRIVAIRDDRPRADGETRNGWQAFNAKGRPLRPGTAVPETYGFIHAGKLRPGFSDWRSVPGAPGTVVFRTEVAADQARTLTIHLIGTPSKLPPGATHRAIAGKSPWPCPEKQMAHVVTVKLAASPTPRRIEIAARATVNCSPRINGLAISLERDENSFYTKYEFRPVKRSRPGKPFAIRSADGVYLTNRNGNGQPTADAFRLGLVPIVGTGAGDTFSVAGLLAGSKLPAKGLEVRLTIDSRYQAAAQEALDWGMARFGKNDRWADERKGAVVVIDTGTGAVLAAANHPVMPEGVNPWDYAAFSTAFPLRDPSSVIAWEVIDKHNTPGSTFKPIVSLALMRAAAEDPAFRAKIGELLRGIPPAELFAKLGVAAGAGDYTPPGSKKSIRNFGGRSLGSYQGTPLRDARCGKGPDDPNIGLRQMVKHSVNHWFARVAVILGQARTDAYMASLKASDGGNRAAPALRLFETARWLGIDDKAPLDLASNVPKSLGLKRFRGASSDILYSQLAKHALGGMSFNKKQRGVRTLILFTMAQNGIGQSLSVAPLHMAQAIASIAGGAKVRAYLIARWGETKIAPPKVEPLGVDPEFLALLHTGMKAVPENGTAAGAFRAMKSFRCRTFGKTGTADVAKGAGYNTGWFVGWRDPAEGSSQRKIAFACMTTHATGAFRFGGSACAPVIARMLKALEPAAKALEKPE